MTTPIAITGTVVGAEDVSRRLSALPAVVKERIRPTVERLGFELRNRVVRDYLTGQALKRRTGRLARSVNLRVTEGPTTVEARVGTNLPYGRFWELGFVGTENVRAHTVKAHERRTRSGGTSWVREYVMAAHTRTVNVKPRPFLHPALESIRAQARADIARALTTIGGLPEDR